MKIKSAEFVKSVFDPSGRPADSLPEIAFVGRSNVGKSSLLNALLGRKALARTSNTPGRTQSINYFLVNESFFFVDLPGYGYARVSKSVREGWGKLAGDYLTDRNELVLTVQLIDARHPPTPLDLQLHEWLAVNDRPHVIVATKSDKLSNNELVKQIGVIHGATPESAVIIVSALKGRGLDNLWAEIEAAMKNFKIKVALSPPM